MPCRCSAVAKSSPSPVSDHTKPRFRHFKPHASFLFVSRGVSGVGSVLIRLTHCWHSSPLNGPNNTRCSASTLNNHDSRSGLCVRRSPLPGNRIPRPETARPKTPASRHGSRERLKRESRSPPIRGYSTAAGKSLVACECVVETRGLELRAWHAVTSNQLLPNSILAIAGVRAWPPARRNMRSGPMPGRSGHQQKSCGGHAVRQEMDKVLFGARVNLAHPLNWGLSLFFLRENQVPVILIGFRHRLLTLASTIAGG